MHRGRCRRAGVSKQPFHDDDGPRVESQRAVVTPDPELRSQRPKRLAFARIDRGALEVIDDGELQIRRPAPEMERQERAVAVQRDDVDARETLDHRSVHDDERASFRDRHQFGVARTYAPTFTTMSHVPPMSAMYSCGKPITWTDG
jgi:hypothetical protein